MKVCIAEKPSVARELAKVLGAQEKYDGYIQGNGYQITWTFGHFCGLYEPNEYFPHWKRWDLNSLPMLPKKFETKVINDQGVQKQFGIIKKLCENATEVINCGDAGQEGELIQRWVLKQAGFEGKVRRLWISSLTNEAIKEGFKNLQDAESFDNLYYAGSSRAIGDWLLGINATRLYTLKYGRDRQVLSIGRVQTPTLAMIVNRFLEIENFISKPFWEIQTQYRETTFYSEKGKFTIKEEAEKIASEIKLHPLSILSADKKNGKELPPRLFDLTSLQVECNKKYGFSADQTLKLIQSLYEKKVVTYPRVDTTYLPNDMYPKIEGILKNLLDYRDLISPLLGKKIRKSKKVFDDKKITDHHAIIPTGEQTHLQPLEHQVYEVICKRFIANFYPDCLVANTLVKAQVNKHKFKATGKVITDMGWRVVYTSEKKKSTNKDKEQIMPAFVVGESGNHFPSLLEKKTNPPKQFTEATLLRSMEMAGKNIEDEELRDAMKENGIGRPSTRAGIIETLFRRQYIKRNKKQILPTQMGVELISLIENDLLLSPELTGKWEKQLREIEAGSFSAGTFIKNMKKMVDDLVFEVRMSSHSARLSQRMNDAKKAKKQNAKVLIGKSCPACENGKMIKGKSGYGCNQWKNGCKFVIPFEFMGKKVSENQWIRLLDKNETTLLKGFKQGTEKVDGKVVLDEYKKLQFFPKENQATKENTCPKCHKGTLLKGKTAYGCSQWKQGCDFSFEFDKIRALANGQQLTKELVLEIIAKNSN
ncbi:MAG: DNA topoisomerase 3 [Flavobacteriales bacterium]|jgi:DNA topoisomerase-3|nr:DNA topoisomerase 3 [Flavobacteriales bacterium]